MQTLTVYASESKILFFGLLPMSLTKKGFLLLLHKFVHMYPKKPGIRDMKQLDLKKFQLKQHPKGTSQTQKSIPNLKTLTQNSQKSENFLG